MLYSTNQFLFYSPYPLICMSTWLPQPRLDSIRFINLRWTLFSTMWNLRPKQISDWFELWQALASFASLQGLKVNIPWQDPYSFEEWSHDLWWLDPVRMITAPSDFELLMPIDVLGLHLDASPSACRIIGHPSLSAPGYLSCIQNAKPQGCLTMDSVRIGFHSHLTDLNAQSNNSQILVIAPSSTTSRPASLSWQARAREAYQL